MAYDTTGFTFDPSRNVSFDPSYTSGGLLGVNPYVPSCNDTATLEKNTHRQQYMEVAKTFGQRIAYQPTRYNLNTHNFIYGEDPTSGYSSARYIKAMVDFSSYSTFLTKFGMMSDADIIIYIPIDHFKEIWGTEVYPLAGDIFYIVDSACDRPLRQTPMVFEVTDKHDTINPVDYMGGHYVWKLTAKRFDYSYEPNATEESNLGGPSDSNGAGRLEGGENPPDPYRKESTQDVDEEAKENFNNENTSSIYGKYL